MRSEWPRLIVHADMDAFYAAVEQLDDPALRGRPLLVGSPSVRGVVLTASYEARPYGVGSAMPMAEARRRCPQALVVPPRFERYRELSRRVMAAFAEFAPAVEALSLDEAFLDMSGSERILGPPARIGQRIKDAVRAVTGGLTVSVGLSATKYVAKVASGHAKPDGLTVVPPDAARGWLAPQPVARLWGAGPKMQDRLQRLGLPTIGAVAACDVDRLRRALGAAGPHLHALARAEDPRPVEGQRVPKSIGSEATLEADTESLLEIRMRLREAAEGVARRLRATGFVASGVRVKLKRHDFRLLTRQRRLPATDVADDLYRAATALLPSFGAIAPVRLVGLAAFELAPAGAPGQRTLLGSEGRRELEVALDRIDARFGAGTVRKGVRALFSNRRGRGA